MRPLDTSEEAYEYQIALFRGVSMERKAEMVAEMSALIRELACAGIRDRHPEFSEAEVAHELLRLLYGKQATRAITN